MTETPLVVLDDLSVRLGDDGVPVQVLSGVSLQLASGRFFAVTGPSGSGKSTLLSVLGLLEAPTTGRYLLSGRDVGTLSGRHRTELRARSLGFVFQSFQLIPRLRVLQNVMLPMEYAGLPRDVRLASARRALDRVGLLKREASWPHELSGGEQQRVAIARAIAGDPLLLLADEPTGSLDSRNRGVVLDLLQSLNSEGVTIALVTHDSECAAVADSGIVLEDGAVRDQW